MSCELGLYIDFFIHALITRVQLGCFISIMAGVQLGRKRTILVGCSLVTIGGALQASAFGIPQLYIGRVIAGTGTGLTSSAAPMWLSECAGAATRGRHVAILLAINAAGFVITFFPSSFARALNTVNILGCSKRIGWIGAQLKITRHHSSAGGFRYPSNVSTPCSEFLSSSSYRNHHDYSTPRDVLRKPTPSFYACSIVRRRTLRS